jgi:hypothetical protein
MKVKEIETAIAQLPPAEIAELAGWFDEFRARLWDQEIEQDLSNGRLQTLLDETKEDLESGRCKPL